MKLQKFFLTTFFLFSALACFSQATSKKSAAPQASGTATNQSAKSSPAYAEILLQKTELEAQLEEFADYTEEFPKVKELRFQVDLLQKAADKFLAVAAADAPKLSLALGRLTVRKIELETNLWLIEKQYKDDYPEVKRLKRKIAVFERAIREILPTF